MTLPLRRRLAQTDTWLLEVFLGLYTLLWGLWFANPTVDSFGANPSYTILGLFPGGETAFGVFAAVLGAIKLLTAMQSPRPIRGIVCAIAGAFWVCVVFAVGVPTHWSAGGIPHFALVALSNWYIWARLSQRGGR